MEEIPAKSRAALSNLLSIVKGARSRSMSTKELGTLHARQRHFIKFLNSKNLGNNVALKGFTVNTRNIIMACYAADLASRQTLLCKATNFKGVKLQRFSF